MKNLNILVLAILMAVFLAGCSKSSEAPATARSATESLAITAAASNPEAAGQPVEDASPAQYVSPPVGQPVHMPEPDPGCCRVPPDSQTAIQSLQLFDQLFRVAAADRGWGSYPNETGLNFDVDEGKVHGRYPAFTDNVCEFSSNNIPTCYMGANTVMSTRDVVNNLPYLLNEDIRDGADWLECNFEFCVRAENGRPIGRIQPEMQKHMKDNYQFGPEGRYQSR